MKTRPATDRPLFSRLIVLFLLVGGWGLSQSPNARADDFWLTQDIEVAGYLAFSSAFQDAPGASRLFPFFDTGLLIGKSWGKWRFFTELEFEQKKETIIDRSSSRRIFRIQESQQFVFEPERLWLQYSFPKAIRLRGGQILTSFGLWNPQHFPAITNVVNRPRATTSLYPEHFLGGELHKETKLFSQPTSMIFYGGTPSAGFPSKDSSGNGVIGGYGETRLLKIVPGTFGLSGLYLFNHQAWGNVLILGTDFKIPLGPVDLKAEFIRVVTRTKNVLSSRTPQGSYVQGLWHVNQQWGLLYQWDQILAGFSENFDDTPETQTIHTFGLLYTPKPWLRVKTDWEKHEGFSQWDFELSFYFSS
ncbi:MAG: hypothetical protein OEY57_02460 [Nitrospirota bacterium]|nr:hypothetical protein [Nitrospirota bacterium]